MVAPSPKVAGLGVAPEALGAFARANGLIAAAAGQPAQVLAFAGLGELPAGYALYCELDDGPAPVLPPDLLSPLAGNGFAVSVTTATAFSMDLAFALVAQARRLLPGLAEDDLLAALQEAVGNALLHGNLGIGAWSRPEDILRMGERIRDSLAQPDLAARRIHVCFDWAGSQLAVAVTDHGKGFDCSHLVQRAVTDTCGRGLAIIGAKSLGFEHGDGGRTIRMIFRKGRHG